MPPVSQPRVYSSTLRAARWSGSGIARASFCASRARRQIFARRHQPREAVAQRADRRRDRHVVVVEDDDQPVAGGCGIVHRLIGHAGAHRAVADHRDRPARLVRQLVGDGEAERGRDAGRAVRRAERVIFALAAPGEAAEAPALAKRADAVAAAGDDLVRIGLVADVPDQLVARACRTHNGWRPSARPRRAPRPDARRSTDTAEIISARSSSASCGSCALSSARMSAGELDRVEQRRFGTVGHARALAAKPRHVINRAPSSAIVSDCSANCSARSPRSVPRTSITGRGAAKPASWPRPRARRPTGCRRRCASSARRCRRSGRCSRAGSRDARWRHRRWRFRPAARGWRRRTGRGCGRRCWPRPAAPRLRDRLGDVIGAGRLVEAGQRVEHRGAHVGPLLAALGQPRRAPRRAATRPCAADDRVAAMVWKIGLAPARRKRKRRYSAAMLVQPVAEREDRHSDHRVERLGAVMRQVRAPAMTPRPRPPTALGIIAMLEDAAAERDRAHDHRQRQADLVDHWRAEHAAGRGQQCQRTVVARQCTRHSPERPIAIRSSLELGMVSCGMASVI